MNYLLWKLKHKNPIFSGDYESMEQAGKLCRGYEAEEIFEKVKNAALAVKNKEACYERDSFLFYEKKTNYNLMMYFYKLAYKMKAPIGILDWGGSLGSTYFQHKDLLVKDNLVHRWTIIEQPHFVTFGKDNLEDEILTFEHTDIECVDITKYDCILMSAVLHYLEDYQSVINKICNSGIKNIILERTPVCNRKMICIEKVKEPIYNASYAMQVFREEELKNLFQGNGYQLADEWESLVDGSIYLNGEKVKFKSFVFERGEV